MHCAADAFQQGIAPNQATRQIAAEQAQQLTGDIFKFHYSHLVTRSLTAAGKRTIRPDEAFGHAKKPLPGQILVFLKAAGASDSARDRLPFISPVKQQRKAERFYR
jgi:hypothetical protein